MGAISRDWQGLGRAVHLARGGMDEAPHTGRPGGLEGVEGARHVGVDERLRRDVRVRDRDQRSQVEYDLDALGRGGHEACVADVAEPDVQGRPRRGIDLVEPTGRSARVVDAERPHVGALCDQPLGEVAADESVRSRDHDPGAAQVHVAIPRAAASCSRCPTSIHSSSISKAPTGSPAASRFAMSAGVSTRRPVVTRATTEGSST